MAGIDALRHHRSHEDAHGAFGNDKFGVAAEKFARFLGTPKYLASQSLFVALWMAYNGYIALRVIHGHPFDPYPWILLNLLFSTQAAYAAPLILLAQTRAAARDKAAETADAKHREELANAQLAELTMNTDITRKIHDLQERQMEILGGLSHINAELNVLRQAIAPGAINPTEGVDNGGPGSDQGSDS